MANDDVIYRFLDKGSIPGIYARDLTQADFDRLTLLQQRDVMAGTLYKPVTKTAQTDVKRMQKAADDVAKDGDS